MKDLSIWQRKNISNNREILTNYSQTSQKHLPCRNGVSWPVLVLFCSPVLHLLDFASELSRTLQLLSQAKCGKQTNKQINISHSESLNCRDSKPLFSWMQRNENSSALFEWRVAKKQRFSFLDLTKHKFFEIWYRLGRLSLSENLRPTHLLYTHVCISQQQTRVRAWIFVD